MLHSFAPFTFVRILSNPSQIGAEVKRLLAACEKCDLAVAWASTGFPLSDLLGIHSAKIERMIVGTHFFQTAPKFIERFRTHPGVRFVLSSDGVFHPKVYLFTLPGSAWECVIGSPNFTAGGFGGNAEVAVLVSNADANADGALATLSRQMDHFWNLADHVSDDAFEKYQQAWEERKPLVRKLLRRYGNSESGDKGKDPTEVPLLSESWSTFFEGVKAEPDRGANFHSMDQRLSTLRAIRKLFATGKRFHEMELSDRKRIAGLPVPGPTDGVNFFWFGSTTASGIFWSGVNGSAEALALALDQIPDIGAVTRDAYMAFVARFRQALPQRELVAPATRLLAMKRPDYFVCLNNRNKKCLCSALGIRQHVGFEDYWDSIIERVQEATWWKSLPPSGKPEREVWEARAAFLDARSYDGRDMPSPNSEHHNAGER